MKKAILLMLVMAIAIMAVSTVNAEMLAGNITFRYPTNNMYNASSSVTVRLNASVNWTSPTNLTNVSFIFSKNGNSTYFINNTVNGSRTTAVKGDFTVDISLGTLAEGTYTVVAEIKNDSSTSTQPSNSVNSSSITFVIDRSNPSVSISSPYTGSTVLPSGGNIVTFDWTPSDTNFGNCSLHLNNQLVKSRTSGTTGANFSSGSLSRFDSQFSSDNSSVRVAINCIDLAGLMTGSNTANNFTFGVITSGFSPAQRQAIAAAASGGGGGGSPQASQSGGFTAAVQNTTNTVKTSFQKWAWAWIIGGVIVLGLLIRKLKK